MKKILLIAAVIMSVMGLVGCGKSEPKAAAIQEEVDKCEVCNMLVKDDHFAAQLLQKGGKVLKFDDIGCMYEWKKKNGEDTVRIEFVRDNTTKDWVKTEDAYYAYDPTYKSPMAYGVFSFEDRSSAEQFVKEQGKGKVMSATELSLHTWERNKEMMDEMMKKMGDMEAGDNAMEEDMQAGEGEGMQE